MFKKCSSSPAKQVLASFMAFVLAVTLTPHVALAQDDWGGGRFRNF